MPQITIPNSTIDYIQDGEPIQASVANRPNIQIEDNVLAIKGRVELNWGNLKAILDTADDYSDQISYAKADLVKDSNTGDVYISQQDNNLGNDLSDTSFWKPWYGLGGSVKIKDTDPTISDTGYSPGSFWFNTSNNVLYLQINSDTDNPVWVKISTTQFLELKDVPDTYSGEAGKILVVNDSEDALVFTDTINGGAY